MSLDPFFPYGSLAKSLTPYALDTNDGSHDHSHIVRVWKNAFQIQAREGGDPNVLGAAVLLHDCVSPKKDSPFRVLASRQAAEKASEVLRELGWSPDHIDAVSHAIEAHSFSAGISPETQEAKILQDADRLDAMGMIGVARCFYVAGQLGQKLYDLNEPDATNRPYDDSRYAIDHFHTKLFKLAVSFQTTTGRQLANIRQERLQRFLCEFLQEI